MKKDFIFAPEGYDLNEVDIWGRIYEAKTYGTTLKAKIVRIRELESLGETWEIEFPEAPGVTGLVPWAQSGLPQGTPMRGLVGASINVKVLGVDRAEEIVACSRKEAVEGYLAKLLRRLTVGESIPALVKFLWEGNVFLDLGGGALVKLLPEKARISRGTPLTAQYQREDKLDVIVTKLDQEKKSIEVALANPWEKWIFQRGEILVGTVVTIRGILAFIRVKPGIVGLAPNKAPELLKVGEQQMFQVNAFDPGARKLHLVVWNEGS